MTFPINTPAGDPWDVHDAVVAEMRSRSGLFPGQEQDGIAGILEDALRASPALHDFIAACITEYAALGGIRPSQAVHLRQVLAEVVEGNVAGVRI